MFNFEDNMVEQNENNETVIENTLINQEINVNNITTNEQLQQIVAIVNNENVEENFDDLEIEEMIFNIQMHEGEAFTDLNDSWDEDEDEPDVFSLPAQ
jgi:hypothetical protein